jgi:UPF0716 protein FxsA
MFALMMFLFVSIPILELYLLVQLAGAISWFSTIGVVIVTGMVGAALARREGLKTLNLVQQELAAGRVPTSQVVDGMLILVAGAVLITPGIITDVVGFFLLIPPIRALVKRLLARYFRNRVTIHQGFGVGVGDDFVDVEVTEVRDVDSGRRLE